jgi:hypothetical protein
VRPRGCRAQAEVCQRRVGPPPSPRAPPATRPADKLKEHFGKYGDIHEVVSAPGRPWEGPAGRAGAATGGPAARACDPHDPPRPPTTPHDPQPPADCDARPRHRKAARLWFHHVRDGGGSQAGVRRHPHARRANGAARSGRGAPGVRSSPAPRPPARMRQAGPGLWLGALLPAQGSDRRPLTPGRRRCPGRLTPSQACRRTASSGRAAKRFLWAAWRRRRRRVRAARRGPGSWAGLQLGAADPADAVGRGGCGDGSGPRRHPCGPVPTSAPRAHPAPHRPIQTLLREVWQGAGGPDHGGPHQQPQQGLRVSGRGRRTRGRRRARGGSGAASCSTRGRVTFAAAGRHAAPAPAAAA